MMNPATICFRDAAHFQVQNPSWTLVHGVATDPVGGKRAYAWLERNGMCFDAQYSVLLVAHEFYKVYKIQPGAGVRYSADAAKENMKKYQRYSRWA